MGGIRVKNLELFNKALLAKLAWKVLTVDSFVYDFLPSWFFNNFTMYVLLYGLQFVLYYVIFIMTVLGFWVEIERFLFIMIIGVVNLW